MAINSHSMRYFFTLLLIIFSFNINAQNRFPTIDSAKNYVLRFVKNSAVETFTNWRAQNVAYGTLELLDSLASDPAVDSIWKNGDTLRYRKAGQNYTVGVFTTQTPTLQQVTTAGNSTTDTIKIKSLDLYDAVEDAYGNINLYDNELILNNDDHALLILNDKSLSFGGFNNIRGSFITDSLTQTRLMSLPDSSGVLTQRVAINGTTYNTAANGVVDLGTIQTDTATVVKAYVTNAEAVTITKGQVVYIFGAQGDRASVKLAKNTSDTFSSKTLGIVRADIAAGQAGWVTTQGQVSGINLGAYTAGDILWLDSVAGGFTKTKPVAPYHSVFVGVVERANAGNGLIYVKPQNGVEVDEIHDILITNKKIGDGIVYTGSLYENKQVVLKQDTIPLAVFNIGSAAAGDTAAFSTSTLAGSFYLDGTDTMFVTSYRVALQGTSASITPEVWFNDSLNVTAGGTRLATGSAITNLTTGTSVTPTTNKIPPANFVFVRFSAVTTKPTYFTLTLFGYRIRKQ